MSVAVIKKSWKAEVLIAESEGRLELIFFMAAITLFLILGSLASDAVKNLLST